MVPKNVPLTIFGRDPPVNAADGQKTKKPNKYTKNNNTTRLILRKIVGILYIYQLLRKTDKPDKDTGSGKKIIRKKIVREAWKAANLGKKTAGTRHQPDPRCRKYHQSQVA